ncbi:MAG TPA: tRNA preQ1(34) S-adenosylmethionine ribosyltransferase-isomerase QueA [bacterium]|nr:tRNA preQ1(34) S-adenosylmethionine ribosyltransferase-isomerase QueA [bacterium]HQL62445.1 tRNA preQ1(34) S-adenosylmethionine ribosyltransferase-isomerase QueA [bacterium]
MDIREFDYELPPERIAQVPVGTRDLSRLLAVNRRTGEIEEYLFRNLPQLLRPGDVLVVNDSWVMPARIFGTKAGGGAKIEVLLLEDLGNRQWKVIAQRASRLKKGTEIQFPDGVTAEVRAVLGDGLFELQFFDNGTWNEFLERNGQVPLPPYIHRNGDENTPLDRQRYQTVYAQPAETLLSAAAPTAGLHFTKDLLDRLHKTGVSIVPVTLRVGLDTFLPIRSRTVENHPMHRERYRITESSARAINTARQEGCRIIAVGTTAVRVLESAADRNGVIRAQEAETALFIRPGYPFKIIDGMITNFHLPRSTLIILIAAWLGRDRWRGVYEEAIRRGFRFYSYGDAMLAW